MATQRRGRGKQPSEQRDLNRDPFHYYKVQCRWKDLIGGTTALRPTLPDHMARVLADREEEIRRQVRRTRASQRQVTSREPSAEQVQGMDQNANGGEAEEQQVTEQILTDREKWLQDALADPLLDEDARRILQEVLGPAPNPGRQLAMVIGRSTTTFPKDRMGQFYVPASWFMGALQSALEDYHGLYREQAQRLKKRMVSVHPERHYLGVDKPDSVREINVQLEGVRPGQAQASIKRIHMVDPRQKEFTLVVKVVDSPREEAIRLMREIRGVFTVMGEADGVGGGRPYYGKFEVADAQEITDIQEARALIAELERPPEEVRHAH